MTGFSSSRDELVSSLKSYTSLLAARNEALSQVWVASAQIRSTLADANDPDISDALTRRNQDIARYSELCHGVQDESLVEAAVASANTANGELAELARSVVSLREDSRSLAERVLQCQSECETLLKSRLEATAQAIKQSTQRRKLDSAYGPAVRHETPTFMDKQR